MVESQIYHKFDRFAKTYICNLCGRFPESSPSYYCSFQHNCCANCYQQLKRNYRGLVEGEYFCPVCNSFSKFKPLIIDPELLQKFRLRPTFCRTSKIVEIPSSSGHYQSPNFQKNPRGQPSPSPVTVQSLFGLSKHDLSKLFSNKSRGDISSLESDQDVVKKYLEDREVKNLYLGIIRKSKSENLSGGLLLKERPTFWSRKPVICPHFPCHKMTAVSAFSNHFRYEHKDIPRYAIERHEELLIPFDVSDLAEYGVSKCVAIVTAYEINKTDLVRSRSTQSVIRTCSKFCQKVPLDTFWVIVSTSHVKNRAASNVLLWICTNSEESYKCTIDLSSKSDSVSNCCLCFVNGICENIDVGELSKKMDCLQLSHGSIVGLLQDGLPLNLRITIR